MIPRNLKHFGPYADKVNNRAAVNDGGNRSLPDDCKGALKHPDGGLYLPWGPYVNREQLATMQRDLLAAVGELARLECWPDEYFDHVAYCIERQPISTLRPDLVHFTERLRVAQAEEAARLAMGRRSWKDDR